MRPATLLLPLLLVSVARADDAYWTTTGGVGSFAKSKNIRMESETVRIKMARRSMFVRAEFNFKNYGGAEMVTMAFPDAIEDYKAFHRPSRFAIKWFRSSVDGKPVRTWRQVLSTLSPGHASNDAVWLKKVSFSAHQSHRVVCEYESRYPEGEDEIIAYYVLRTGATWKGTIRSATIDVDWTGLHRGGPPNFLLTRGALYAYSELHQVGLPSDKDNNYDRMDEEAIPTQVGSHSARFEFRNLEPKKDFLMSFPIGFPNFFINGDEQRGSVEDDNNEMYIKGPPSDPLIQLQGIPQLIGTLKDVQAADNSPSDPGRTEYGARGKTIEFPDRRHICVNGKTLTLRRPLLPASDGGYPPGRWVRIRDLVQALGGSFRYDSRLLREDIYLRD